MKILDLYILKKLASTFIFVIVLATCLLLVFDYVDNADTFYKKQVPLGLIFSDYYINLIPYVIGILSPIIAFVTVIYVTSKMASRSEIIAMFTGGVSFPRFLLPYLAFSSCLAVLIFILLGWVIPLANTVRIAFENKYLKSQITYMEKNVHIRVGLHSYAYVQSYNSNTNVGKKFTLEHIEGNDLKYKLSSDSIGWNSKSKSWQLYNYHSRTIRNDKELHQYGVCKSIAINLSPEDFSYKFWLHKELSLGEIDAYIEHAQKRGNENIERFLIEKYQRYSYPFTIILLTFMAVIFSFNNSRRDTGVNIAIGFLLVLLYLTFTSFGQSFAEYGNTNPLLAVIFPNILFAILGFIIHKLVIKL